MISFSNYIQLGATYKDDCFFVMNLDDFSYIINIS